VSSEGGAKPRGTDIGTGRHLGSGQRAEPDGERDRGGLAGPPQRQLVRSGQLGVPSLVVMLPNGSSNTRGDGRADTSAFLELGRVRPVGYGPGEREYFPRLPGAPHIQFLVGRPQDAPALAARGFLDAFLNFGDVVEEAREAGLSGVELVLELPYGLVEVAMVARQEASFSTIGGLLSSTAAPIRCVSETPFLARKALHQEEAYRARFGHLPPVIELHGTAIAQGCESVRVAWSARSCEPHVSAGFCDCAAVVKATGSTIRLCGLKVIKTLGTYRPGLYCRAGVREDPSLAAQLDWFVQRLEVATGRWDESRPSTQLDLEFR